jgi:hypothetical protein
MGRTLQRIAVSTNIKERLDFSCALFSADGGLVANAPHIPVHLGSMQEAVRYQMELHGKTLKEGDVLVTNHPDAGGSHLPDITVITPVFDQGKIVFFVASRGHHAGKFTLKKYLIISIVIYMCVYLIVHWQSMYICNYISFGFYIYGLMHVCRYWWYQPGLDAPAFKVFV